MVCSTSRATPRSGSTAAPGRPGPRTCASCSGAPTSTTSRFAPSRTNTRATTSPRPGVSAAAAAEPSPDDPRYTARMSEYVWQPDPARIEQANVTRLMRALGFAVDAQDPPAAARAARAFVERSCRDIEWFWEHALRDIHMPLHTPYARLLDTPRDNACAVGHIARDKNRARACRHRHAQGARGQAGV